MSVDELRQERLKKIEILKEAGMEPYPARTDRTIDIHAYAADFTNLLESGASYTLAGRVMSLRGQGGIIFADLFDGTARIQLVLQESEMDSISFKLFVDTVDAGDFVEVAGSAYLTKRGERSVLVKKWKMLSKSLIPLPSEWFGVKDEELRLRERYLDVLLNPELRAMFERRSHFWRVIREFLIERGFLEVETPVFENTPGGADARPFITHHNALNIDVYLRISTGELWQKRLLVAGFPKVFEIGRIFRNEGQSNEHLQDYTQMELYEAYSDYHKGMEMIADLYRRIVERVYGKTIFSIRDFEVDFSRAWQVINFCEIMQEHYGIDPVSVSEADAFAAAKKAGIDLEAGANKSRAIDQMWKIVRKTLAGPAFLVNVPIFMEPLAKKAPNGTTVERMQIIIAGSEVGKGYSELNDPQDQRARFEEQQQMRDQGDEEAQRLDEDYVRALEYGMPPAFGFGVSERLFAFLEGKPIHETQLFPLLRPRSGKMV